MCRPMAAVTIMRHSSRAPTHLSTTLPRPLHATDLSLDTKRSNVRVAYQGSHGTVVETMVRKTFPESIDIPYKKFERAFEAVHSSLANIVVLPIENSSTGSFHQNYDLLLRHKLHIIGEVQMDVELCLLALPGVEKNDLRRIFSHPEGFPQCEHSLSNLGVTKKNVDHGAAGAEDALPNLTRYLVLAKIANNPKTHGIYKTSIIFGLEEGPGVLYKAIGAFCKRKIILTKIDSRLDKGNPMRTHGTAKQFNYIFYVDFEASMAEIRAQNTLRDLEEIVTFLRVLGCYPMSTTL